MGDSQEKIETDQNKNESSLLLSLFILLDRRPQNSSVKKIEKYSSKYSCSPIDWHNVGIRYNKRSA